MSLSTIPHHVLFEALRNDPVNKLMVVMKAVDFNFNKSPWKKINGKWVDTEA